LLAVVQDKTDTKKIIEICESILFFHFNFSEKKQLFFFQVAGV
jgi:hypothetical protein